MVWWANPLTDGGLPGGGIARNWTVAAGGADPIISSAAGKSSFNGCVVLNPIPLKEENGCNSATTGRASVPTSAKPISA